MPTFTDRVLDYRPPEDRSHERTWGFGAISSTVAVVNKTQRLPYWHWTHDQGYEGSCVGHGAAMERAICNTTQNIFLATLGIKTRRYDPIDIWNNAKAIDEWADTNPGDSNGTSVHAAYDVLRDRGPRRVKSVKLINGVPTPVGSGPALIEDGCSVNRWARTVDEMRTSLSQNRPVTIGVNWYVNFDQPILNPTSGHYWIGTGHLGGTRGGHSVCVYGASDTRQAFRIKNSWGSGYPLVWMPYSTMARLLAEDGEATVVTDR